MNDERVVDPLPPPPERFRCDSPDWMVAGLVALILAFAVSPTLSGAAEVLTAVAMPAAVRAAWLAWGRPSASRPPFGLLLLASLGACAFMAVAAAVACASAFVVLLIAGVGSTPAGPRDEVAYAAAAFGVLAFLACYVGCWPRPCSRPRREAGDD